MPKRTPSQRSARLRLRRLGRPMTNRTGIASRFRRKPAPAGPTPSKSPTASAAPDWIEAIANSARATAPSGRRPAASLFNRPKFLRQPREVAVAVVGRDDEVLYADAELAGQVDPGLNRDRLRSGENIFGAGGQARRLVNLEPDTLAEALPEKLFLTPLF